MTLIIESVETFILKGLVIWVFGIFVVALGREAAQFFIKKCKQSKNF